ncbi:MAG: polysaccharide biosynthesis C-terminal domain-containing protein [Candidatus Freyarchaeota archaeon]
MIEGIQIKPLIKRPDERGFFTELIRRDWKELLQEDEIMQANLSISYPNIIRAWHRHLKGQVDYFIVLKGAIKICVYEDETRELREIISTGEIPQIVRIPGKYWHGFKVVGNENAWLLYFVNRLYNYSEPDEERRPWDDPTIIPEIINGRKDDPRVGKPWNWNYPPHK